MSAGTSPQKQKNRPSFEPDEYWLEISQSGHGHGFLGKVKIKGKKLGPPSRRITLRQNGLKLKSAEIIRHHKHGPTSHLPLRINHIKSFGEVRLHTDANLYPGPYKLEIEYEGRLTDELADETVLRGGSYSFKTPGELELKKARPEQILPCF